MPHDLVFLLDVDNTLLDNDRAIGDLSAPRAGVRSRQRGALLGDFRAAARRARLRRLPGRAAALPGADSARDDDPHCCRCRPFWWTIRSPTASSELDARDRAPPAMRPDGHPFRRRRRVSAAQGPALGSVAGGRRPRADLHPQGGDARSSRAALPGPPLRPGRRQAAHPGGGEAGLGKRLTTVFARQGHYALDPLDCARYL